MRMLRAALPPFALLLAVLAAVPARADYGFTFTSFDPPGTRPGPGDFTGGSNAHAISTSGAIAGTYGDGNTSHGYVLENGAYTQVDYPLGSAFLAETFLFGINSAGTLAGTYILYDPDFNVIDTSDFLRHNGAFLAPQVAGATQTDYSNVNDAGLVASIYYDSAGAGHGAIYDLNSGAFTLLADPAGASNFFLQTIGPDGELIGSYRDASGAFHGVLIRDGQQINLDFPGAGVTSTRANALSGLGLVGGRYVDASGSHGFAYDPEADRYYTIDYPGAAETFLFRGTGTDQFVGAYRTSSGELHSLLVTVRAVPEPGSLALMAIGLGGSGLLAWRRRRARRA